MTRSVLCEALTAEAFAPFGDVIAVSGPSFAINGGMCERFHDIARLEVVEGRFGISLGSAKAYDLPLTLSMVERHPLGSQAFVPMGGDPFVVVAAPDEGGRPGMPRAFVTEPFQGVNYLRNTWHGVLTPLRPGRFLIVDRIGTGSNLEEHFFDPPWVVEDPKRHAASMQ